MSDMTILGSEFTRPWFASIGIAEGKKNMSQGKFYYRDKNNENFEHYDEIIPHKKCDRFFDVFGN